VQVRSIKIIVLVYFIFIIRKGFLFFGFFVNEIFAVNARREINAGKKVKNRSTVVEFSVNVTPNNFDLFVNVWQLIFTVFFSSVLTD